ncbi:MAG: hypothetical protein KKF80_06635 [Candidatus Omnitrophica bacterium]|nr:hypothetical protein [Candidatus Omnitrophota bacterium]
MEKKNINLSTVSIVLLVFNVIFLFSWAVIAVRFNNVLEKFGLEQPLLTKICLSSRYVFPILALVLILKEFLKRKLAKLMTNAAVILFLFIFTPIFIMAVFRPIFTLSNITSEATQSNEQLK